MPRRHQVGRHLVDAYGPAEGGAFLAHALASVLEVAVLPAYRVLPDRETTLGWLPAAAGAGRAGGVAVAIVDDAINAGTAIRACSTLLVGRAASVAAVASLISLGPARETWTHASVSVPFYAIETMSARV